MYLQITFMTSSAHTLVICAPPGQNFALHIFAFKISHPQDHHHIYIYIQAVWEICVSTSFCYSYKINNIVYG